MDLSELIRTYLSSVPQIAVASCAANRPWICTVYYAFDSGLNLYFVSKTFRRHSEEIRLNPSVAAAICEQHPRPFEMPCRGIQLEGACEQLEKPSEVQEALAIYLQRFPASARLHRTADDLSGSALRRIFRIIPEQLVLFDERNFPDSPQQTLRVENG